MSDAVEEAEPEPQPQQEDGEATGEEAQASEAQISEAQGILYRFHLIIIIHG